MLAELVQDIRSDFIDEAGDYLVSEEYAERAAERTLPFVATDLDIAYVFDEGDVTPAMPGEHRELWILRTKVMICGFLRAQSASRVSFSSGDKKMDRSKEAATWAALEKDLRAEYKARVTKLNPAADDSLLTFDVAPKVYERGVETESEILLLSGEELVL